MTRLLPREELDRLLIEALTAERERHLDDDPPDTWYASGAWRETAAEHGVDRWLR